MKWCIASGSTALAFGGQPFYNRYQDNQRWIDGVRVARGNGNVRASPK
jgi:hypothetical protein